HVSPYQQRQLPRNSLHHHRWYGACELHPARPPVDAFNLVVENDTRYGVSRRQGNFERVTFLLACHWTQQREPHFTVVTLGRENHCRAQACLFVPGTWIQRDPHHVTASGAVGTHQISRPRGLPVSISSCRFRRVIFLRRSSSLNVPSRVGVMTILSSSSIMSTAVSVSIPNSFANAAGIRRARLFPHFCTLVCMSASLLFLTPVPDISFGVYLQYRYPSEQGKGWCDGRGG